MSGHHSLRPEEDNGINGEASKLNQSNLWYWNGRSPKFNNFSQVYQKFILSSRNLNSGACPKQKLELPKWGTISKSIYFRAIPQMNVPE